MRSAHDDHPPQALAFAAEYALPAAVHVLQPFTQLGGCDASATQQRRSVGPLQVAGSWQHTAWTRSPHDVLASGEPGRRPLGHVEVSETHMPPCSTHPGGGVAPHVPSGWTEEPAAQTQIPSKHVPVWQSGLVVQAFGVVDASPLASPPALASANGPTSGAVLVSRAAASAAGAPASSAPAVRSLLVQPAASAAAHATTPARREK
jgi:hypothetical protein